MRSIPLTLFALAAASPLVLLALSLAAGGLWPWVALIYSLAAAVGLDLLIPLAAGPGDDREFPAADALLVLLALATIAALPLLTWIIAAPSDLGLTARILTFLTAGLWFGQVSHPAAHELIHRPRPLSWLGLATYTALLFGHHTSSHRLVHHRHVATPNDPNTAHLGEGYYRFLLRAWPGSLIAGFRAEQALRATAPQPGLHPYAVYTAGALACLTLGYGLAGWPGLLVWLGFGLHSGAQILLSDYVQHYGLTRSPGAGGKLAPVAMAHSWNAPHLFSSALMLNATRHSDHHAHPARPYPALHLPQGAPMLPWPLPLACLIALFPPLWRARMRPLVAKYALPQP